MASTSLAGKIAIVTGSSRGIGYAIAYELARRGAKVCIVFTTISSEYLADELISKIVALSNGSGATKIQADLSLLDSPRKVVEHTLSAFSSSNINILVNNAARELVKPLSSITPEDFSSVYDLNARGTLFMTQAIIPYLPQKRLGGGRIINVSSVGARQGFAALSLYNSSKAAMEGMTRCWAAELGAGGHTVNAVAPGPTESEMIKRIPTEINRLGTADDIAQIVAFLASEESRWITGQVISASGGLNMY
ncbi:hypothetical protein CPB83DRAFT_875528 [Crepidotus variabilis]|uniref:Uncharacterized protein n=1 Tax=Crepidotus variabilis TaxID=179855 RepID=A0A9P6EHX9_9AGAR|nr:hypothetical protein CPB83DRAFT_875528 [Crepidotus variabilis]